MITDTTQTTEYQRGMLDAASMLDDTAQGIRLACGEITADEMRVVMAVLKWKKSVIESRAENAGHGF